MKKATNLSEPVVIFMDGGKIVEEGKPQDFFENPQTDRLKKFLETFTF